MEEAHVGINQSLTQRITNGCKRHLGDLVSLEFLAQGIPTFTYLGFGVYGEALQEEAVKNSIEPDWITGHLSDFSVIAALSAFGLALSCKNRYLQAASMIIPPSIATYLELGAANCDGWDIAVFWAGAAVAYLTSKAFTAKRLGDLYGRIIKSADKG